jgi:hypothetical protein
MRKKLRRVDPAAEPNDESGWQEFDKKAQSWVALGAGEDPMAENEKLPGEEGETETET